MPETTQLASKPTQFKLPKGSIGLKLIIVCVLVIFMAIPAMFISHVSYERSGRADEVTKEVSQRYGGEQYITGPVLVAPYSHFGEDGTFIESGNYAVFADKGHAEFADIKTQIRKRSLFKVPTFQGPGILTAQFKNPRENKGASGAKIDWSRAKIIVGLSDVRGLKSDVQMVLPNGQTRIFEPAHFDKFIRRIEGHSNARSKHYNRSDGWLSGQNQSYLSVDVADIWGAELLEGTASFTAKVELTLGGARRLGVTPFAKSTTLKLSSDWPDPGFEGGFPPDERQISKAGFSAQWSVPFLRRGLRAQGKAHELGSLLGKDKLMSVQFVSTDNPYRTVNRTLKYAVLFIGLVFLAYFLFETIIGVPVHPAQYILIGLAQSIFYLLLLAFSERVGFTGAFIIAAGLTIAATAGYAGAVFGHAKYRLRAGGVFLCVYGLLFALMRMQDFALMVGALASFTAIAATMYLTRHLDWYGLSEPSSKAKTKSAA